MYPFMPRRDLFPPNNNQLPESVVSPQGSNLGGLDFNPSQVAPPMQPPVAQPQQPQQMPNDFTSRLQALMESANGPANRAYSDYLKTYPEATKPNFGTRLGATLSGAAAGWKHPGEGSIVAQQILDQPRVRALQEWGNKGGALKAGAELEDKGFKDKLGLLKETDAATRATKKDEDEASLHEAQRNNYTSLIKERDKGKVSYHENKTDGHLWQINEDGSKKDLGVMDLTPQQKEDLKVTTFNTEEGTRQGNRVSLEGIRQGNRKNLFDFTNSKIGEREKDVHKANREVDVNNPLPTRSTTSVGYESIDQQNKAITAAAKELNIENAGKYSHLFNADGTLIDPSALKGGFFADDKTQELKDFYDLAKKRADEKLAKQRPKSQSTATSYPPVRAPQERDSRIQP